jgi:hypothetical protein
MSDDKNITKKVQLLIKDLSSKEEKKILKTLTLLEADGNECVLRPLVELYLENRSENINGKVIEFLSNLSDSSATPEMIEIIREDKYQTIRRDLLNTMWQTKLDFSAFLADFVAIACEGTYLEGPFQENQTLESQLYLKEYLDAEKGKDEARDELMSDIAVLIRDFDRAIQE